MTMAQAAEISKSFEKLSIAQVTALRPSKRIIFILYQVTTKKYSKTMQKQWGKAIEGFFFGTTP